VDTSKVSALGFGGGSLAAFYLSMRSNRIKSLVCIEGGIFMPLSKITLSDDYKPANFKIPLLHVVNPHITEGESDAEVKAVHGIIYRVNEKVQLRHHDFILFGAIMHRLFQPGEEYARFAMAVYGELLDLVLCFLDKKEITIEKISASKYFTLDVLKQY
jgi:hypothetical protein